MEHWILGEKAFNVEKLRHAETIFTIGNGYLSTRGVFEEGLAGEERTTFLHGVFDAAPVVFTELANAPDWLDLQLWLNGERFNLGEGDLLAYERHLDMQNALLTRRLTWRSPNGLTCELLFERFASLAQPHQLFQRVQVKPLNGAVTLQAQASLSSEADNNGLKHWHHLKQHAGSEQAWLLCRTRESGVELAAGFNLMVEAKTAVKIAGWNVQGRPTLAVDCQAAAGETVTIEKQAVIYTNRDTADPLQSMLKTLASPARWAEAWPAHQAAWQAEWLRSDVMIEGDAEAQLAVRFSLYHLLIAAPRQDDRVSIGAKTLSGLGYRGHVFWDTETFMLPFFTYNRPEVARNLLSYRWHTLPGARRKAARNGYQGAQFAWESAATGDEVTPTWVPHFADSTRLVRIWTGDIEIHISADVAYAVLQYWRATGDDVFMLDRGAEIVLETAAFWASRVEWVEDLKRYEISDIIGPDEYHDHVDNNAYTNYLVRWHLQQAIGLVDWLAEHAPERLKELGQNLDLSSAALAGWQKAADLIYCPFDPQTGIIEQFDGFFERQEVDLAALEPRDISVQALFGIDETCATQVLKQPDVLMLLYMLPDLLGPEVLRANYNYYTPRTDHTFGSSLGPSIQAVMACQMGDVAEAYDHFMRAARADLRDVRGNAGDGIHGASAGGLWQAVVFGFAGLRLTEAGPQVSPRLPAGWKRVAFTINWRGQELKFEVMPNEPQA
ncbi:MAG TPA: glycoside hydrolase family 65 protein [Anaerolineaceae bacterium]|nr:glycoside hydrolase family 65 protein [Anaerolineaceae bacterium]HPN51636.1 glycoside hydrolase family 65 protein [Anaerolineaceae bacterium]